MDPIVVSPFDAELFGHWWFEGPEFLNFFIRKSVYDQHDFQLTTPGRYLGDHTTLQMLAPAPRAGGTRAIGKCGWMRATRGFIRISTRRRGG